MLHQKSKIVNTKGSYFVLCAHGWAGQTQPPFYWRRFSQSEKRNSAAAEKSDSAKGGQAPSEGGQKFLPRWNPQDFLWGVFPDPFPFCPPERKIKNSFQKKFELDHKSSSRRKIAIAKAPVPTLCAVPSWRFCFGESSSFERSSKFRFSGIADFLHFRQGRNFQIFRIKESANFLPESDFNNQNKQYESSQKVFSLCQKING